MENLYRPVSGAAAALAGWFAPIVPLVACVFGFIAVDFLTGVAASRAAAGQGVFQRYKLSRRDGLHWSFARCAQMPDAESLARWEKLRTAQLERMRAKAEKQAAEK